jgi:glycopeptide antibiotics resistance protein
MTLIWVILQYRKRGRLYMFCLALFGFYLLVVIGTVFFPVPVPENWPANLTWRDTLLSLSQVNLIPFNYRSVFLYRTGFHTALRDIIGNIVLTIPFGFLTGFLLPLRKKQVLWMAVGVGLALEGMQLLLKLTLGVYLHSVDITDVLTNALGVLLGSGFYRTVILIFRHFKRHSHS